MKTSTEQPRWRRSQIAETFASVRVSAPWRARFPDLRYSPRRSQISRPRARWCVAASAFARLHRELPKMILDARAGR